MEIIAFLGIGIIGLALFGVIAFLLFIKLFEWTNDYLDKQEKEKFNK